jgi:serine/threonine-protein kinase
MSSRVPHRRIELALIALFPVLSACTSNANAGTGPDGSAAASGGGARATGGATGSGGSTSSGGSAVGGTGANACGGASASTGNGPRDLFPADHFFYKDVSCLDAAANSDAVIAALGAWGNGGFFQIDFSITVLTADSSTPTRSPGAVAYATDSDLVPFPFPTSGTLEGEDGYACLGGGDCHLLVIEQDTRKLYEAWAVDSTSTSTYDAGSTAVWDLDRHYGPNGRGAGCTSADAAGFPIVPGLIGVEELAAGEILHALRFALPNPTMRRHAYVYPATHYGSPSNRDPDSPPYGVRLRLKSSFDESSITTVGGRAVVRALKRYGMLLADGGEIALMAESDRFTTSKWRDNGGTVDLGSHDLRPLQVTDFEVVDFGTVNQAFPLDDVNDEWPDCVREP